MAKADRAGAQRTRGDAPQGRPDARGSRRRADARKRRRRRRMENPTETDNDLIKSICSYCDNWTIRDRIVTQNCLTDI